MNRIDLIIFLKSLSKKFKDIDFIDPKISAKISKLYVVISNYCKKKKLKDLIIPENLEFKTINGHRGKLLSVEFDNKKISYDDIKNILETENIKIDLLKNNKKIMLNI